MVLVSGSKNGTTSGTMPRSTSNGISGAPISATPLPALLAGETQQRIDWAEADRGGDDQHDAHDVADDELKRGPFGDGGDDDERKTDKGADDAIGGSDIGHECLRGSYDVFR